jgi:hypothetical protein
VGVCASQIRRHQYLSGDRSIARGHTYGLESTLAEDGQRFGLYHQGMLGLLNHVPSLKIKGVGLVAQEEGWSTTPPHRTEKCNSGQDQSVCTSKRLPCPEMVTL